MEIDKCPNDFARIGGSIIGAGLIVAAVILTAGLIVLAGRFVLWTIQGGMP